MYQLIINEKPQFGPLTLDAANRIAFEFSKANNVPVAIWKII